MPVRNRARTIQNWFLRFRTISQNSFSSIYALPTNVKAQPRPATFPQSATSTSGIGCSALLGDHFQFDNCALIIATTQLGEEITNLHLPPVFASKGLICSLYAIRVHYHCSLRFQPFAMDLPTEVTSRQASSSVSSKTLYFARRTLTE